MLSPPDAELVARDPTLPGLRLVLDAQELFEMLRQRMPGIERPLRYTYLRYKPSVSALVGFQVRCGHELMNFHAQAHRTDAPEKLRSAVRGCETSCFVDPKQCVVLTTFPHDRRLRALRRFADPSRRAGLFRRLFPQDSPWERVAMEQLRYKPERRFVGCLRIDGIPSGVLKLHRTQAFARANAAAKYLESRGSLRLPARLGRLPRHAAVVSEWLEGNLLADLLADATFDLGQLSDVGEALAHLHAQSGNRLFVQDREQEIREIVDVVEDISRLAPQFAPYAHTLANKVADQISDQQPQRHAIHGDFYPQQIILATERVGLLDLDQAACGDPATDLGNFWAHLHAAVIRGELSEQTVGSAMEALGTGYQRSRPEETLRRVDLYTAANLLRLTPHPFRNRDPDWPDRIEAMLDCVDRISQVGTAPSRSAPKRMERFPCKVEDPFNLRARPELSFLAEAFDPSSASKRLSSSVKDLVGVPGPLRLDGIRVVRHKIGRRCLIEYKFSAGGSGAQRSLTLVGKVRLKGVDRSTWTRMNQLWQRGFSEETEDEISVPRPVAIIPEWRMWLQQKVPGTSATELLPEPDSERLGRRIAESIHKLQRLGPPAARQHTGADELQILKQKLPLAADANRHLASRIEQILIACERRVGNLPNIKQCPIHRDFYPDHVLVDENRLHLLDLDLYCQGNPGLDIGNFCAHLQEQSLRECGRADAMADRERAITERFIELTGEEVRESIDAYLTFSLVRHIYLSGLFPARRPFTLRLVELCESKLGLAGQKQATLLSMQPFSSRSRH